MKYPNLSNSKVISFDIETYDPDLLTKGPAVYRGGYILGIALADGNGFTEYYNLKHYDCTESERKKNLGYLKEVFESNVAKLGMSILYDLDWIQNFLELKVNGQLWDIQIAESLINENQGKYSLNFMGEKYLGIKKYKDEIDEFCEQNNLKGDSRRWLWKMDYSLVKKYAIQDVKLPLQIFKIQWNILQKENLLPLFHMEMAEFPMLIFMRKKGVRINEKKLASLNDILYNVLFDYEDKLNELAGFELNYRASIQIAKVCDSFGLIYPRTLNTGTPSFTKPWLEQHQHEHGLFNLILKCRKYYKVINTFLESQIGGQLTNGLIRTVLHPCKTTEGGTVTGRFSSSNPNLQFIPSPKSDINVDEPINLGKEIRSLFIPFKNMLWGRIDYNQVELRLFAHFAIGKRSNEIRETFQNDPNADYHQWCADIAGVSRAIAKNINFGLIYGMGLLLLCQTLRMNETEGMIFLDTYNQRLPFIKTTLYAVKSRAESRGYVKTILGRRRRFPNKDYTYKALNAIVQGSAADIMKKAMKDSWEAGIYNVLIPLLTEHDELDISIPRTNEGFEAFGELKNIMENTIKIKVPIYCDCEIGENWGSLSSYNPKQGELFL